MRYKLEIPLTARVVNGLGLRRNRFAELTARASVVNATESRFAAGSRGMPTMNFGKRI